VLACVLERRMTSFGRGNIISLGEVGMYMGVGVDAKVGANGLDGRRYI